MGFGKERKITSTGGRSKVQHHHARLVKTSKSSKVKFIPTVPSPHKKAAQSISTGAKRFDNRRGSPTDPRTEGVFIPFGQEDLDFENPVFRSKDSNDYMCEWLPKKNLYLERIIQREAPPNPLLCSKCASTQTTSWWKCLECMGTPLYCVDCCRDSHMATPFHRVESLQGDFFVPSWLWHCGVYVNLCIDGCCSPSAHETSLESDGDDMDIDDPSWVDEDDRSFGSKPGRRSINGMKVLAILHTNGLHHLPVLFCSSISGIEPEYQLLRTGLYPATSKDVRTAFSFTMLDEYLLETLECFTSTHHYYSKVRRLTNEPFPETVPDRSRELRRVGRQWRHLKDLKRGGFGHLGRTPGKGELALFCAACPQPGINLPEGWERDPEEWKYTRSLVADGNFTCIHRKQRRDEEAEVVLKSGQGYITERSTYLKHLDTSQEQEDVSTSSMDQ